MLRFSWIFLVVSLVPLIGCRTPDPTVDLLESELRWMEDNLYHLDHQLDLCHGQLSSAQRSNAALRNELAKALGKEKSSAADSKKSATDAQDDEEFDKESEEDLLDLNIPKVEVGKRKPGPPTTDGNASTSAEPSEPTSDDADQAPALPPPTSADDEPGISLDDSKPGDGIPQVELEGVPQDPRDRSGIPPTSQPPGAPRENPFQDAMPPGDDPVDSVNPPKSDPGTVPDEDHEVSRILLNPQLTGLYDDDDRPGADGILVVVEPQNRHHRYVPVPGDVSIQLWEVGARGPKAPLALWNFDTVEAAGLVQKTLFGKGIHLRLPWPSAPPATGTPLQLRVVYDSPQGKRLVAQKTLRRGGTKGERDEAELVRPLVLESTSRKGGRDAVNLFVHPPLTLNELALVSWSPDRNPRFHENEGALDGSTGKGASPESSSRSGEVQGAKHLSTGPRSPSWSPRR